MRGLHWRASDPARRRLGHGIHGQQGRWWDEAIQRICLKQRAAAGEPPEDWHEIAVDREVWKSIEPHFVNSVLRRQAAPIVHRGRFMIGESPGADWL